MPGYITPGALLALGSVLPALGIIAVGLRFYARRFQKSLILADDWLIVVALLTEIVLGASLIAGVEGRGLGYPTPRPDADASSNYAIISPQEILSSKVEFIFNFLEPVCLGLTKLSIVYFYRRIFCVGKSDAFSIATWTIIGAAVLFMFGFSIAILSGCGAHPEIWWASFGTSMAVCFNGTHWLVGMAATDFILDALIFLMPIIPIWRLQMGLQKRLAVLFIFLVGALTVVASIIKLVFVIALAGGVEDSAIYQTEDPDTLTAILLYWSALESGLGIIVACLPTCHIYFNKGRRDTMARSLRALFSTHASSFSDKNEATTHSHSRNGFTTMSARNISDDDNAAIIPPRRGEPENDADSKRDTGSALGAETYPLGDLEASWSVKTKGRDVDTRRWEFES